MISARNGGRFIKLKIPGQEGAFGYLANAWTRVLVYNRSVGICVVEELKPGNGE